MHKVYGADNIKKVSSFHCLQSNHDSFVLQPVA